jgi:integrase
MRQVNRLKPLSISKIKSAGMYHDGGGLYLQVTIGAGGVVNMSWIVRYMLDGKARKMGLGAAALVSLPEAREKALAIRRAVHVDRADPIELRNAERSARKAEAAKAVTFEQCARAYIEAHESSWSNERHRRQWPETLGAYVYPTLGALPVASIDTALVMKALEPLWREKEATAVNVRSRIERILSWATVRGFRQGDNPARWRGHLDQLLARRKLRAVKHLAALPYSDIPAFMAELRERAGREGVSARALEFAILTGTRSNEVLGAKWDEIVGNVWTIPPERTKARKEHRVPLSGRALEILSKLPRKGARVFEGHTSPMTLLRMLKRVGRADITPHGFRSSLRTWAGEATSFPHEVCEQALGHTISSAVERAYQRGDLFDKRRKLMDAWAAYCAKVETDAGKVVALARGRTSR